MILQLQKLAHENDVKLFFIKLQQNLAYNYSIHVAVAKLIKSKLILIQE